jgi:ABC-2 type transport system permease protein
MTRSFISEWVKLRRRGMVAALASVVGVTGLVTLLSISRAGLAGGGGPRGREFLSLAALQGSSGLALVLGRAAGLLGVIALGVFASSFASEFSQGTLRNLLARQPRRLRLLAGKYAAMVSAAAVAVALAVAASIPVALLVASNKGLSPHPWLAGAGLAALAHTVVNLYLATVGWGTFGALLAIVFRSPVPAIGFGVAWALPLEAILSATVNGLDRWLPGQLLDTLAAGGNATASYHAAALTLAAYGALAAAVSAALFARRDVVT